MESEYKVKVKLKDPEQDMTLAYASAEDARTAYKKLGAREARVLLRCGLEIGPERIVAVSMHTPRHQRLSPAPVDARRIIVPPK